MNDAFVGTTSAPIELEKLQKLVKRCIKDSGWQFLRWPHRVKLSHIDISSKDFSTCYEGQAFDQTRELRWKRQGAKYAVLLLSDMGGDDAFSVAVGQSWKTKAMDAKAYPATETRFPRKIETPAGLDWAQRYFIDVETACVQFIAMRAK